MKSFEELADDAGSPQLQRAWRCARELAGERATRGIVKAMLELVESVEKGDASDPPPRRPGDAAKVLVPPSRPKPRSRPPEKPQQEELTLW